MIVHSLWNQLLLELSLDLFIAPLWKSGGYTGFALSFHHSVTLWVSHSITFQMKIFITLFSVTVRPRRLKLGTHVNRCIVYTAIMRLLLLICPFIFFIFLSSNFQTLKFFVTLFSGTVRPRRLKLGTHVDNGQMYRLYKNQAAAAYLSLYFSFFFLSSFQTLKVFVVCETNSFNTLQ